MNDTANPAHDRTSSEPGVIKDPPGGYRPGQKQDDTPAGWREIPADEQHTPAGREGEPLTPRD